MAERNNAGAAQRQARWLLWQMGAVEDVGAPAMHQAERSVPPEPAIPRSRYNAVIQRMKQANQRTGTYTSWT